MLKSDKHVMHFSWKMVMVPKVPRLEAGYSISGVL